MTTGAAGTEFEQVASVNWQGAREAEGRVWTCYFLLATCYFAAAAYLGFGLLSTRMRAPLFLAYSSLLPSGR